MVRCHVSERNAFGVCPRSRGMRGVVVIRAVAGRPASQTRPSSPPPFQLPAFIEAQAQQRRNSTVLGNTLTNNPMPYSNPTKFSRTRRPRTGSRPKTSQINHRPIYDTTPNIHPPLSQQAQAGTHWKHHSTTAQHRNQEPKRTLDRVLYGG